MILKGAIGAMSPAGQRARLTIFIFHRVYEKPDPLFPDEVDVDRFNQVLNWIGKWFRVFPLDSAVEQLRTGTLPSRAAAITFDDGYADNAVNAMPILKRHGMTATFFVATSFLEGGRMWNDSLIESIRLCGSESLDLSDSGLGHFKLGSHSERFFAIESLLTQIKYLDANRRSEVVGQVESATGVTLPDDLMMTYRQVIELRYAGMQIGAHTRTHPILSKIEDTEASHEIRSSKSDLESLLCEPVTLFAYPNGKPGVDYLDKHAAMVKQAGFVAAVSTAPGASSIKSDIFQLPRFTPWDKTQMRFGLRLLFNLRTVVSNEA